MAVQNKKLQSLTSIALSCTLVLILVLSGCGKKPEDAIVGEYYGTSNSYLKINSDGTCVYTEDDSTGTGTGIWILEDTRLSINVGNLKHIVYADISEDSDGFLLKADSSNWNDEYFKKSE